MIISVDVENESFKNIDIQIWIIRVSWVSEILREEFETNMSKWCFELVLQTDFEYV